MRRVTRYLYYWTTYRVCDINIVKHEEFSESPNSFLSLIIQVFRQGSFSLLEFLGSDGNIDSLFDPL